MEYMKKFILFFVAIALSLSTPAYAGDNDAIVKLGRGFENIVTSPLEYVIQYEVIQEDHNVPVAVVGGLVYGTLFTVGRILGGVYEVISFPVPLPENYAPLMEPATALEAWQDMQGEKQGE